MNMNLKDVMIGKIEHSDERRKKAIEQLQINPVAKRNWINHRLIPAFSYLFFAYWKYINRNMRLYSAKIVFVLALQLKFGIMGKYRQALLS